MVALGSGSVRTYLAPGLPPFDLLISAARSFHPERPFHAIGVFLSLLIGRNSPHHLGPDRHPPSARRGSHGDTGASRGSGPRWGSAWRPWVYRSRRTRRRSVARAPASFSATWWTASTTRRRAAPRWASSCTGIAAVSRMPCSVTARMKRRSRAPSSTRSSRTVLSAWSDASVPGRAVTGAVHRQPGPDRL